MPPLRSLTDLGCQIRTAWSNGHVRKAVRMANRQILLPVTAALAFAVFGPAAALGPIILLMPHSLLAPIIRRAGWEALSSADHFFLLLKSLYPALPGWYSHYITSRLIAKMVNQWLGKVRDRTFLDYRRLRKSVPVESVALHRTDSSLP